jgi:hypothetical protein
MPTITILIRKRRGSLPTKGIHVFVLQQDNVNDYGYVQWLKRAIGMAMAAVGMSGTDKGTAHKHNN